MARYTPHVSSFYNRVYGSVFRLAIKWFTFRTLILREKPEFTEKVKKKNTYRFNYWKTFLFAIKSKTTMTNEWTTTKKKWTNQNFCQFSWFTHSLSFSHTYVRLFSFRLFVQVKWYNACLLTFFQILVQRYRQRVEEWENLIQTLYWIINVSQSLQKYRKHKTS